MEKKEVIIFIMILIAMATRFLFLVDGSSVLPNFTAVGAIAIFGAVQFKGTRRWVIPLVLLWVSDLILNNIIYAQYYDHFQVFGNMWVYISFLIIGVLAFLIMKKASWFNLLLTGTLGAIVFFMITNFGVWLSAASPYSKDFSGLIQSYEMGIPFFRNTLLSNVFFSFALFGIYELVAHRSKALKPVLSY